MRAVARNRDGVNPFAINSKELNSMVIQVIDVNYALLVHAHSGSVQELSLATSF